ncbi:MAG: hypothetical protein JXE06_10675, partial [Coriobacteriia bacterium]|nr:hypothetical protein [Coriobacteriia bacterium]
LRADVLCGPEVVVGGVDEYDDFGVQIDVDSHGRVWAVWSGYDSAEGDTEIMYSLNTDGAWSEPTVLHGANTSSDRFPVISIGADDVPWVVWYRAQENGERLWYSSHTEGAWTAPAVLRDGADRYDDYDIVAVSSSDVWVATDAHLPARSHRDILIYHWDGSAWSEPWELSLPEHGCYFPDFALDPSMKPWVVWTGVATGTYLWPVMYSRWTGTEWALPDTVNGDLNNNVGCQIVFDDDTPMVLWNGNLAANVDVEYSRLEGGEWTAAELVNLPDASSDALDKLGSCESGALGDIAVVWSAANESQYFSWDILSARWSGGEWTPESVISSEADQKNDRSADVAIAGDGTLWSAWVCYEEISPPWDEDIRATSCVVTTPVEFGPLYAECAGSTATITWWASGDAQSGPFYVWRSTSVDACGAHAAPDPTAVQLNVAAVEAMPHEWVDGDVPPVAQVFYWVEWRRPGGSVFVGPAHVSSGAGEADIPAELRAVSPNPARTGAAFHVTQALAGVVEIGIYTIGGREVSRVRAPRKEAIGERGVDLHVYWDGKTASGVRAASGIYMASVFFDGVPVPGQKGAIVLVR